MNLRRRKNKYAAEVSTSSLNDIMFFLLLFFLIISTLVNPSVVKLTLPNSTAKVQQQKQPIVVAVDKDLKYSVNNVPVSFDLLESAIAIKIKQTTDASVVLRIDNGLTVQDLVDILQIGDRLKVRMVLATKSTNG